MLFILYRFTRKLFDKSLDDRYVYTLLFLGIADVGMTVTGLGNTLNITWCYWLLLGISYVVYVQLPSKAG